MNLISISQRFPDQQACIKYLEEPQFWIRGPQKIAVPPPEHGYRFL